MTGPEGLSAGRQVLRDELRDLEMRALQSGRTRKDAIDEASRRLQRDGLRRLSTTTVGGWFEQGSPARDFQPLWALVRVLLEWAGNTPEHRLTGLERAKATGKWTSTKELWQTRWEQARTRDARKQTGTRDASNAPAASGPRRLIQYLQAARDAATQHPYPGVMGDAGLPPLAQVYVRQQTRIPTPKANSPTGVAGAAVAAGTAGSPIPADEVFSTRNSICVLLAGPGGGKSSLLRVHLADSAGRWLGEIPGGTVPVVVSADALTGTDPLPKALATATTAALGQFGLLDELDAGFFRRQPRTGVPWLVMVDGLDELPDRHHRGTVLRTLTAAAAAEPALYRFVVATRPLPPGELDTLGTQVPRFELLPFTRQDLHDYAEAWFHTLDEPERHASAFTDQLQPGLDELARTPLMASMLCQLYAADPSKPLPSGRIGAYQAFIELVYEQNTHKNITRIHEQAIQALKSHHQIPKDLQAADHAAQHVRDHLPELIDHLAHEKINGNTTPTLALCAQLLPTPRPAKIKEHLWNAFLGDLLRPTGLLTQHTGDFHFLHKTHLEYHAARHATRTEETRTQLLHTLFPAQGTTAEDHWEPPDPDVSYLLFLIDCLLAPRDQIATQTLQHLDDVTARGGLEAGKVLLWLVRSGTALPDDMTAVWLTRLAQDTTADDRDRIEAAWSLTPLPGYEQTGADLLARLAQDTTVYGSSRVAAAEALARMEGYEQTGVGILTVLIPDDSALDGWHRVRAAHALGKVNAREGIAQLVSLATQDSTLHHSDRLDAALLIDIFARGVQWAFDLSEGIREDSDRLAAATELARLDAPRGAARLTRLAQDTSLASGFRVRAADTLAQLDARAGAEQLSCLAGDTTLSDLARSRATEALVRLRGDKQAEADRLTRLADDTTRHPRFRVEAAEALARLEGHEQAGVEQLTRLAQDTSYLEGGFCRVDAAEALARLRGHEQAGADLLARLAEDVRYDSYGVTAAEALARLRGDKQAEADRLTRLVGDTTHKPPSRVGAAEALARLEGHEQAGVEQLTRLARDTTLHGFYRVDAAEALAWLEGHEQTAADQLARLAQDATLDGFHRVCAAESLTALEGHEQTGAGLLSRLAQDTTLLYDSQRTVAAEALARLRGHEQAGADLLSRLAQDTTVRGSGRVEAARALAALQDCGQVGAGLLSRLAQDTTVDGSGRVEAARALAALQDCGQVGAGLLSRLAQDTTLDGFYRVRAAESLTALEGHEQTGAGLLSRLAQDATLDGFYRVCAAESLTALEGHEQTGAELMFRLARDTTLDGLARSNATEDLARLEARAGADRLTCLARDTTLDGLARKYAAMALARLEGHEQAGVNELSRLAQDTALDGFTRMGAAEALARLGGHEQAGADLLSRLAQDTALDSSSRLNAAQALARLGGHEQAGVDELSRLAQDTTLDGFIREHAARALLYRKNRTE
ncbi:hypothetical protein [Streptomyces sp. NK08204]|uniref:hypothetical protein n=1 Tax=Streptomyces sp. NK08204 TaxID=2873260 RepID=UPI001CED2394|nr:hypothetical protein [Streptomyces sp. NK08204]